MGKLIPIRKRGRLQGYRNFAGGLIAAILAWVAGNWFIADRWLGNGYATTFLFAFVLTSAGLVVLKTMIREPAAPLARPQMPMRERVRSFPSSWPIAISPISWAFRAWRRWPASARRSGPSMPAACSASTGR